jgi:hypothetical protein
MLRNSSLRAIDEQNDIARAFSTKMIVFIVAPLV